VIHLAKGDTAQVDLFITLVDRSGKSHQVIFFIPLGKETRGFKVVEELSRAFDDALTKQLDKEIRSYGERIFSYKKTVQAELFLGALLTNGLWIYPTLAAYPEGSEYIYRLSTGSAWASPIELTRIYVVAPPGTDFEVQYPTLGDDLSGIEGRRG
jgi:hypothetical protein